MTVLVAAVVLALLAVAGGSFKNDDDSREIGLVGGWPLMSGPSVVITYTIAGGPPVTVTDPQTSTVGADQVLWQTGKYTQFWSIWSRKITAPAGAAVTLTVNVKYAGVGCAIMTPSAPTYVRPVPPDTVSTQVECETVA